MERITHRMMAQNTLYNIQSNLNKMSDLNEQATTGKTLNRPSDSPARAVDSIRYRNDLRANEQYTRNADDGAGWTVSTDTALQTSVDIVRRARNLALEGVSTGKIGPSSAHALATELEQLSDSLFDQSNTMYLGRPVFAGNSDAGAAYTKDTATPPNYTYTGTGSTQEVNRRVAPNTLVRVDVDGPATFGPLSYNNEAGPQTTATAFEDIRKLASDIRAAANATTPVDKDAAVANIKDGINKLDVRNEAMLTQLSNVGSRSKQIEDSLNKLKTEQLNLKSQISGVEDADLPSTITELMLQEVAYKASLSSTEKVLQPSLLDFLR